VVATGLILLYHRVADLASDPQRLTVTPAHFNEHLDVLRRCGTPMPLRQLVDAAGRGALPPHAFAVTFDDGYEDNLDCGEPLLARHDIPATIFVTSSYVGSEREFWWDDLERVLLVTADHQAWHAELPDNPSPRHRLYRTLCELLRRVPEADRRMTLDELARSAGVGMKGRATHRAVARERLARACDGGLVDIGVHSATHPMLSALSLDEQRDEIQGSRQAVREITGMEPAAFSYPFGGRRDYTPATIACVRDAGFDFACANIPGLASTADDRFQVPRMLVRDWDGDAFSARVHEWFGA
jgi:peptidoglycan/xylan/chitin deacetylase (PgdA/CDA1 family)